VKTLVHFYKTNTFQIIDDNVQETGQLAFLPNEFSNITLCHTVQDWSVVISKPTVLIALALDTCLKKISNICTIKKG
jgi:hypothetical protein